jgi:hypothetical protein
MLLNTRINVTKTTNNITQLNPVAVNFSSLTALVVICKMPKTCKKKFTKSQNLEFPVLKIMSFHGT